MYTWRRGTRLLFEKTRKQELPLIDLAKKLDAKPPHRVPGTAVFLTSDPESAPTALLHSLKHYKVLHEKNVILTVHTEDIPRVSPEDRVSVESISKTFSLVRLRFGFMETPNVPKALAIASAFGTFGVSINPKRKRTSENVLLIDSTLTRSSGETRGISSVCTVRITFFSCNTL